MTSPSNNISDLEKVKIDHLAIIMDGNRRWAKNKNLRSKYGHKAGITNAIKLLKSINSASVNILQVKVHPRLECR